VAPAIVEATLKYHLIHCGSNLALMLGQNRNDIRVVFQRRSTMAGAPLHRLPPILHRSITVQCKATVKVHGSFRLAAGRLHHHKHFNFAESQERQRGHR